MLKFMTIRRSLIFVVLISTFLLFPINVFAHYQDDKEAQVSEVLSHVQVAEESLRELDLSLKDFKGFESKDASFYDGSHLQGSDNHALSTIILPSPEELQKLYQQKLEKAKKESNKWIYASKMATINQKRDPNFTNLNYETVYMYLSHYVDIKTGVLDTVNPLYSDDVYYSAWIVNDDRRTYDTFLNGILQQKIADIHLSAMDINGIFLSAVTRGQKYAEQVQAVYRIFKYTNYLDTTTKDINLDWKKLIKKTQGLYNQADTFEEFSQMLDEYMEGENYSELITDYFKKILIDMQSLGDLFSSSGIVDYIEQIQFKIGHGMIQKFRWIALVQYNGMRVSQRMMRYYSGQGFDF